MVRADDLLAVEDWARDDLRGSKFFLLDGPNAKMLIGCGGALPCLLAQALTWDVETLDLLVAKILIPLPGLPRPESTGYPVSAEDFFGTEWG